MIAKGLLIAKGVLIMAVQPQKMKTLYLMQILLQRTDEKHLMSANDIVIALQEYGSFGEIICVRTNQ